MLKELSSNAESRARYKDNALRLVQKNHNVIKNAMIFQQIIKDSAGVKQSK